MTETSSCFTDKQPTSSPTSNLDSPQAGSGVGVSRSTSNVFRLGDYNLPSHTSRGHFLTVQKQDYQKQETVPPAGVVTATKKAYSHVLPRSVSCMYCVATHTGCSYMYTSLPPLSFSFVISRRAAQGPALNALHQLVDEHSRVFQNPRDPTSINVTRAFLNYDKDRSILFPGNKANEEPFKSCQGVVTTIGAIVTAVTRVTVYV